MFKFDIKQKIFDVGGVKIGGDAGQLPTVLIGSIFYDGDKFVKDPKKGLFDKKRATELLSMEEELSLKTGNPRIIDVVGSWPEAMIKYIDFIADTTDTPISLDCADTSVALASIKYAEEVGLTDRVLLNSISPMTEPTVISAMKEAKIKSAIVLTLNDRRPTVEGRLDILGGSGQDRNLLEIAEEAGVEKPLIDVTVLDVPDPGPASKAIYFVKKRYGLPAGCGAHNALGRWRDRGKIDRTTRMICNIALHVMPITMGANFMLYGPIKRAPEVYTACALTDAYVAYCMRQQYRVKPLTREHPLYKIF
jgi:tetrahydromethanopterin S-methyltransferase subunit H